MTFNKEKLLSAKSLDEFKLHLFNPKVLINEIIENDDCETYIQIIHDLKLMIENLCLYMLPQLNDVKIIDNIFEKKAINIITNCLMLRLDKIRRYDFIDQRIKYNFLKYSDDIFTNEQLERIEKEYIDSNQLPSMSMTYIFKDPKTKYLLDYKDIINDDYHNEYIKWLIELALLLQFKNIYFCEKGIEKIPLWHDPIDEKFTKEIIYYMKNMTCCIQNIHYSSNCKWYTKIFGDTGVQPFNLNFFINNLELELEL